MAKRILLFFLIFSALPVIATTRRLSINSYPTRIYSVVDRDCITDVKTGETIASYNKRQAIIPASTIKVITTATALRLYRPSFCLYTTVGHTGTIDETGTLHGDSCDTRRQGDPSLGSAYRCRHTEDFIDQIIQRTLSNHIKSIEGRIVVDNSLFDEPAISPKWMVEDIAWDYGTGCHAFSYKDNRIEINLRYNGKSYDVTGVNPPNRFVVETV